MLFYQFIIDLLKIFVIVYVNAKYNMIYSSLIINNTSPSGKNKAWLNQVLTSKYLGTELKLSILSS